jgi:uncharacterized membrane protein YesL
VNRPIEESAHGDEREYRVPDAPSLGGSIRAALVDFWFNSWRLVPANGLWGLGLLAVVGIGLVVPIVALLLIIPLAVPAAGVYRLAALIARERSVAFSDALHAWRRFLRPALITGTVLTVITFVLGFNVLLALTTVEPLFWVIGTLAGWGLLATWAVALPFWALLTDPLREEEPLTARLRLAAVLVLISPLRFGMLLLSMTVVLIASTILFAALLTISIAFIALVTTRYTLPAADRLEQRQTQALPG